MNDSYVYIRIYTNDGTINKMITASQLIYVDIHDVMGIKIVSGYLF